MTGQVPAWTPPAPDEDVVLQWDGIEWKEVYRGEWEQLIGVGPLWGTGPDDLWVVGTDSLRLGTCSVLHWDGQAWALTPLVGSAGLTAITGTAPDDVWIVGAEGIVWHFDGAWSLVRTGPMDEDLLGVWAADRNDAWAVGRVAARYPESAYPAHGLILHWDGSTWSYWR
ncbi:MAG: hypothetical protein HY828_20830 [Actinobacteria bacterium]|nr:hypothetical protein [Actinomycetota bacterium]